MYVDLLHMALGVFLVGGRGVKEDCSFRHPKEKNSTEWHKKANRYFKGYFLLNGTSLMD